MKLHPNAHDYQRIVRQWNQRFLEAETTDSAIDLADTIADDVRQAHYRMESVRIAGEIWRNGALAFVLGKKGLTLLRGKRPMDYFHEGNAEEVYGALMSFQYGDFI